MLTDYWLTKLPFCINLPIYGNIDQHKKEFFQCQEKINFCNKLGTNKAENCKNLKTTTINSKFTGHYIKQNSYLLIADATVGSMKRFAFSHSLFYFAVTHFGATLISLVVTSQFIINQQSHANCTTCANLFAVKTL